MDGDGDGYGDPASFVCTHPEPDCDDTNPDVNPGMTEIPDNGIDDDCDLFTPAWGTPASILGTASRPASDVLNPFPLILPIGAVLLWRKWTVSRKIP